MWILDYGFMKMVAGWSESIADLIFYFIHLFID